MITSGVCILFALAVLLMAFGALAYVLGVQSAFLAVCWLPMGGLFAAIGLHHHLGYGVLALLATTLAASICLLGIGIGLCARMRREKTATGSLIAGTLIAGLPLVLFAGWLAMAD
jgi:hypothetical protein